MTAKAPKKTMDVPDLSTLLGQIAEKRNELPKAPIQEVRPIEETVAPKVEQVASPKQRKEKPQPASVVEKKPEGRPTFKDEATLYVKISPKIPDALKTEISIACATRRFTDPNGSPIRYIDEFVAEACRRMLRSQK